MASHIALKQLNEMVLEGTMSFTTNELAQRMDVSAQGAVNVLTRLMKDGLVDRVSRGHYVIRQFGMLGTTASSESTALAVGARFGGLVHRIAYRSALSHHSLISRPSRVIYVATPTQVMASSISGRPVRVVREVADSVTVGAESAGHGAYVSDVERSLLDVGRRVDLAGGLESIGEALRSVSSDVNVEMLRGYAGSTRSLAALRRLSGIARVIGLEAMSSSLSYELEVPVKPLPINPASREEDEVWRDRTVNVAWTDTDLAELGAVAPGAA